LRLKTIKTTGLAAWDEERQGSTDHDLAPR
jgi:hypothetical protein